MFSEATSIIKSKYEEKDNKALQDWLDPENAAKQAGNDQVSSYTE
jgi:hypothetical protein